MRILPLSDLHLEFWNKDHPKFDLAVSQPDIVILAGDIHTGHKAAEWAAETFKEIPVLYVHGNHEAYGRHFEEVQKNIFEACQATKNVHFLDCGELKLGNVRFLGATMWTDYCLFGDDKRSIAIRDAEETMNDYRRIRLSTAGYRLSTAGYRLLRASDTMKFHALHKKWLNEKLAEPFDGKTVVVSHMAPSIKSVSSQYADNLVSAAYASNLDEVAAKADLWIHGHMHESFDYTIDQCRVVCNPCGYKTRGFTPENDNFNPNLIIEI